MNRRINLRAISCMGALAMLTLLALLIATNTPVQATVTDSSVPVSITENGFDPVMVTITVGTTVVWTNQTQETVHLVGGEPYRIYLPLVLLNAGTTRAVAASSPRVATAVTQQRDDWVDEDIVPGQSYTHTFIMSSDYPYFLMGHPGMTGLVVVQETPAPPTSEVTCLYAINWWRNDSPPYNIIRSTYSPPCLAATHIEVKYTYNSVGRLTSYWARVERQDKQDFEMEAAYNFNSYGGVTGADVVKTYVGGDEYQMDITKFCPTIGQLAGYRVRYNDQVTTVGSCP
ncbi:MAG: hypothetical protein SXV54_02600 [Chloroflexota bacterium]|nr:hypothetical protein [Chloroflexota bacterium]